MAIAYHSDMRRVAPDAQLVAVTHEWGRYYTERVRAVLDGTWKSGNVWDGVAQGMVKVDAFGPKLPLAVQQEVLARQKEIAGGGLKPFAALKSPVKDNEGNTVIPANSTLADREVLGMNWLVEGVQGKLAK